MEVLTRQPNSVSFKLCHHSKSALATSKNSNYVSKTQLPEPCPDSSSFYWQKKTLKTSNKIYRRIVLFLYVYQFNASWTFNYWIPANSFLYRRFNRTNLYYSVSYQHGGILLFNPRISLQPLYFEFIASLRIKDKFSLNHVRYWSNYYNGARPPELTPIGSIL